MRLSGSRVLDRKSGFWIQDRAFSIFSGVDGGLNSECFLVKLKSILQQVQDQPCSIVISCPFILIACSHRICIFDGITCELYFTYIIYIEWAKSLHSPLNKSHLISTPCINLRMFIIISNNKTVNVDADGKGLCHQYSCHYGATCVVELNRARCLCHFLCPYDVIQQVLRYYNTTTKLNWHYH